MKVSLNKSSPKWKNKHMERTVLGCCNLEGDTATGNPVSLRPCPFNGNHMLLFNLGCDFLCRGGAPLCVDEFAAFHNLLLWIFCGE